MYPLSYLIGNQQLSYLVVWHDTSELSVSERNKSSDDEATGETWCFEIHSPTHSLGILLAVEIVAQLTTVCRTVIISKH